MILSLFVCGYYVGTNSQNKPWLYGGLLGIPVIIIYLFWEAIEGVLLDSEFLLILTRDFSLLVLSGLVGAIVGFKRKAKRNI